jgi:hypothetical protein
MNINSPSISVLKIQNVQPVLLQTNAVYCWKRHVIFNKSMRIRIRIFRSYMRLLWGTRYHVWLRHWLQVGKVVGSVHDSLIGIFH